MKINVSGIQPNQWKIKTQSRDYEIDWVVENVGGLGLKTTKKEWEQVNASRKFQRYLWKSIRGQQRF